MGIESFDVVNAALDLTVRRGHYHRLPHVVALLYRAGLLPDHFRGSRSIQTEQDFERLVARLRIVDSLIRLRPLDAQQKKYFAPVLDRLREAVTTRTPKGGPK